MLRSLLLLGTLALLTPVSGNGQVTNPAAGAQGPILIDSIVVAGSVRQSHESILNFAGLVAGSEYSIFDLQRAAKDLWATAQFDDITFQVEGIVGQGVTLTLHIEEANLLRRVVITGLEHLDAGSVQDTSGLRTGRPYSAGRVNSAKQFIRDELAAKGIPFARIDVELEPVANREKEVILRLKVTEGNRITVADVSFVGNEILSNDDLKGAMAVKPEGFFWWRPGQYDESRLDEDLFVNLPSLYAKEGFLDFEVLGDSLVIDPQTGKSRVEIAVNEGPRYRVGDFGISGNRRFSSGELELFFIPERRGLLNSSDEREVFNQEVFAAATGQVGELYRNDGYLYSTISPVLERRPPENPGEDHIVDVSWVVQEGTRAFIARVDIDGNEFTHDRVIREKIFLLPGDVFSQDQIMQSYQNISSLGFFEVPLEAPSIDPTETGDVNVTFHVREKPTGAVNFGTSVGGGGGLSGFIGYDQPNLFGKAKSGSFRWDFGAFTNNVQVTYTDPAIRESRVSGSVSLFNARDRFISFRSGRRNRIGGSVRFGIPLPNARFTRIFAGYGLSRTDFDLNRAQDDQSLFGTQSGTQSTFTLGISRTTLNHPIFPFAGSSQNFNIDINGGPLGGDGDFLRYTADGSWWLPIGRFGGEANGFGGTTIALGFSTNFGAVSGDTDRFPFDRFWMGGVQFGEQLRGYDETSITPLGFFPENAPGISDISRLGDAFVSVSTELAVRLGSSFSFSGFFDAGNVYADVKDIDPTRLFRGAGFGAKLVTPFGPVGIDYAYGFDKPIPGWQLHFNLGGVGN